MQMNLPGHSVRTINLINLSLLLSKKKIGKIIRFIILFQIISFEGKCFRLKCVSLSGSENFVGFQQFCEPVLLPKLLEI